MFKRAQAEYWILAIVAIIAILGLVMVMKGGASGAVPAFLTFSPPGPPEEKPPLSLPPVLGGTGLTKKCDGEVKTDCALTLICQGARHDGKPFTKDVACGLAVNTKIDFSFCARTPKSAECGRLKCSGKVDERDAIVNALALACPCPSDAPTPISFRGNCNSITYETSGCTTPCEFT